MLYVLGRYAHKNAPALFHQENVIITGKRQGLIQIYHYVTSVTRSVRVYIYGCVCVSASATLSHHHLGR